MATKAKKTKKEDKPKKVKAKKISVNAFEKAAEAAYNKTETITWNGLEVTVSPTLSLGNAIKLARDVVDLCFTDDGEYMPEVKDYAFRAFVLERYANFTLPKNTETQYRIIYTTDAYESVWNVLNKRQLASIEEAIDKRIAHKLAIDTSRVNQQMESLYAEFAKLESILSNTFEGIDESTMTGLIDAIQNGKLDEGKLVDAYFEHKEAEEKSEGE